MQPKIRVLLTNFGTEGTFGYQKHTDKIYQYPLHIHQFIELTLVISGELTVTVGNRTETLKQGQFAMILPFEAHKYDSQTKSTFIIYTFSQTLISDHIQKLGRECADKTVFDASRASLDLFNARLVDNYDFSEYSIRSCLYSMLCDREKQVKIIPRPADHDVISKVITEINNAYTEALPLTELAKRIGYSANYLSHCIKNTVGMNYASLLSCIRCEQAKVMLTEGTSSVLDIALECGFGSERSFHRQFKSITGKTPLEYRASPTVSIVEKE